MILANFTETACDSRKKMVIKYLAKTYCLTTLLYACEVCNAIVVVTITRMCCGTSQRQRQNKSLKGHAEVRRDTWAAPTWWGVGGVSFWVSKIGSLGSVYSKPLQRSL